MHRVYVVDDSEQMRRLLQRQLQADYDVVSFESARQFLDVAAALIPGCLILDLYMPEIDGMEVLRRLAERNIRFPTVMITGQGEVPTAVRAMRAGAVDFVQKPFTADGIRESVGLALERLATLTRDEQPQADAARARFASLSTRERQVLAGLVAGLPNKTIAYDLGLSPRTVESHRARIMDKVQARSLSELVRLATLAGVADERPSAIEKR